LIYCRRICFANFQTWVLSGMSYDYQLETKLLKESPELHSIFSNNVMCCQNMLQNYKVLFPTFTDHTMLHSLEVIAFCNELIGDQIDKINADEIFALLMSAYLHDSGMGVSLSDFEHFSKEIQEVMVYRKDNPDASSTKIIRKFHHELSGRFVRKYAPLFDIPSEEHLFAIMQICRGHRKTDLTNEKEYPSEIKLKNGNVIHIPCLAALIRLADELDIAADRNIDFLYDMSAIDNHESYLEFKKHHAIKKLIFRDEYMELLVDFSDDEIREELHDQIYKLDDTLKRCADVIKKRSPFDISQTSIKVTEL